ncbi:hypothetical protein HGA88_03415 [Candidatus Roizmanbacteria bacterium]|nr:hypothetical protein [Candidatus Roizmanbacteria bacterium]
MIDPYYGVLALFVFSMNVLPGFMPPTWVVLAFFYVGYNLSLLPVVLIGAICATLGRVVLTLISRNYFRNFFHSTTRENIDALGYFFKKHAHLTIPMVVAYAFLPIPSNQVFITVGLTRLDVRIFAFSFFVGRLISYTAWVSVAKHVSTRLDSIFAGHFTHLSGIIIELTGFLLMYLLFKINWKKIIRPS